eukprot:CAMPEP_0172515640 /NCGR_PEP_ID=MMETSP1066-20121228/269602_1 /TAXON_ID=671091 /ORGANISM="Coscinodiscus wailesii, Strain CCMP2513" /LENGTH=231 /DNA_ID=CAMNT_0013296767 /DNA_START=118 /DNA_END=813 /DNA_ORIENTATION=-
MPKDNSCLPNSTEIHDHVHLLTTFETTNRNKRCAVHYPNSSLTEFDKKMKHVGVDPCHATRFNFGCYESGVVVSDESDFDDDCSAMNWHQQQDIHCNKSINFDPLDYRCEWAAISQIENNGCLDKSTHPTNKGFIRLINVICDQSWTQEPGDMRMNKDNSCDSFFAKNDNETGTMELDNDFNTTFDIPKMSEQIIENDYCDRRSLPTTSTIRHCFDEYRDEAVETMKGSQV